MTLDYLNKEGKSLKIEYDQDTKILCCYWAGDYYHSVDFIKEGALSMLDKIEQYKVTKLINDNSQVQGVWDDANDWIAQYWMPKAIELGLKRFAHVVSDDLFDELSAEAMEENSKKFIDQFQLQLFKTHEDARKWLQ